MSLVSIYNCWAGQGGLLKAKFIGACLTSAYAVLNEAGGTTNHANRLIWANTILSGTVAQVEDKAMQMLRYAIASNSTLQSAGEAATDNDVLYIVASQIDTFATGA